MKLVRLLTLVAMILIPVAGVTFAQSGRARRAAPPPPPPAPKPVEEPPPVVRGTPIPVDAKFDTKYAGGSISFNRDEKVTIRIKGETITLVTKSATYDIPAIRVMGVSYGQEVRKRTAEGIAGGAAIPGLGGIIGNTKSTAHYIEIVWDLPPSGGVALRVDKNDYRGLIAALEGATGLKVDRELQAPIDDFPGN